MKEQKHPQESKDREIVKKLWESEPTNYNLGELARLLIRYRQFPGARDIQAKLGEVLEKWQLTEATLYAKTRQLHSQNQIYQPRSLADAPQDWS